MRALQHVSRVVASVALVCGVFAQEPPRATIIRNALVLDGTGGAARRVDVRIVGDRIAAVGRVEAVPSDRVVDAHGLTLAPGFIDTHSHASRGLFEHRDALADVSQGITTVVVGQDGGSTLPLSEYFERLRAEPAAVNVASYVGHGTIRHQVMGDDFKRAATADEVRKMEDLLGGLHQRYDRVNDTWATLASMPRRRPSTRRRSTSPSPGSRTIPKRSRDCRGRY